MNTFLKISGAKHYVQGVPAKRAYKLTSEFVSAFSYPVEKFQDGKQQRFRVRDKFQTPLQTAHQLVQADYNNTVGQDTETLLNENPDFKFDPTGTVVHVVQMNNVRRRDSKLEPVRVTRTHLIIFSFFTFL